MGLYKYLKQNWKDRNSKEQLVQWRKEPVSVRLEYPTRLDRARALGFKAKQGYFVVRQRVIRGGRTNPQIAGGRRSKKFSRSVVSHINYKSVCEMRANKRYPNCEVLNSYYVGKDGRYAWYEVVLVDSTLVKLQTKRAFRGLTSAGRKSRGLHKKGIGTEKVRPSRNANKGRIH